jgi:hypothetical protein
MSKYLVVRNDGNAKFQIIIGSIMGLVELSVLLTPNSPGWLQIVLGGVLLTLVYVLYRTYRYGVVVKSPGLEVRNRKETLEVAWVDVDHLGVGVGPNPNGLAKSLTIRLKDGSNIRCDGTAAYSQKVLRSLVNAILDVAPIDIRNKTLNELKELLVD